MSSGYVISSGGTCCANTVVPRLLKLNAAIVIQLRIFLCICLSSSSAMCGSVKPLLFSPAAFIAVARPSP